MSARPARRVLLTLAFLLVAAGAVVGWRSARGAAADPLPFVGTWICGPEARLVADCGGSQPAVEPLAGVTVAVRPGADVEGGTSDLVFELGCHCRMPLALSGTDANVASLVAPAPCELVFGDSTIVVTVASLTLRIGTGGVPTVDLDLQAGPSTGVLDCRSTSIVTALALSSRVPADCGPDASALGVISSSPGGFQDCPLGAGRDSVKVKLYSETTTVCPKETGDRGEGPWVLPQTSKYDTSCQPSTATPGAEPPWVLLQLCRIDGRSFKPLTTDPNATDQFYALLKLGDGPCPGSSIEMVRRIDDEDTGRGSTGVGHLGPNQISTPAETATTLHFCFFRSAASADDTMSGFPELGFGYGVFHDFDGPQPPWVTLKHWVYSNDELNTNSNALTSPTGDDVALVQFQSLIESSTHATGFDIAWVR